MAVYNEIHAQKIKINCPPASTLVKYQDEKQVIDVNGSKWDYNDPSLVH